MAARQVTIDFDEAVGWIVSQALAGPAGCVSLPLDGMRVTVDAADPDRLVELAIFADSADARVSAQSVLACRELLGAPFAEAMAAGPEPGSSVATAPTPAWRKLTLAARAEMMYQNDRTAPRLAALEFVRHARGLATTGAGQLVRQRAWQALIAVTALGRSAARMPQIVDSLSPRRRQDIAAAIAAMTQVLRADGWEQADSIAVTNLELLLATPSDKEIADILGPRSPSRIREYAGRPGTQVAVHWHATSDDLRARLGSFAGEAFAGAAATGHVPGNLDVQMPLRDSAGDGPPEITVRAMTWAGEILGEARMRIVSGPGKLPRGTCRIAVPAPASLTDVREHGLHVDIAVAALASPGAREAQRAARSGAQRAGRAALLARHAADHDQEAAKWRVCAGLFRAAGEDRLAVRADRNADAAQAPRPTASDSSRQPGQHSPERGGWAAALLATWRSVANEAIGAIAGLPAADQITKLSELAQDLGLAADALPELATAHEKLAAVLLRSGDSEDAQAAAEHLREALRQTYALADEQGAIRLIYQLTALAPPSEGPAAQS